MSGFWLLIFLGRWSMVLGWRDFIQTKVFKRRHEFVSADARQFTNDPRTYEMLDSAKATSALNITCPDRVLSPGQAHPLRSSPMTPEPDVKDDSYFNTKPTMQIHHTLSPQTPAPAYSFQSPSPSTPGVISPSWDHRAIQASSFYGPPGTALSKDYT